MGVKAETIFMPGKKVILSLKDARFPLRFHPWVHEAGEQALSLNLPEEWWKLADLTPGMEVHLSTVCNECIFNLEGRISDVDREGWPSLRIRHDGRINRIQRRTFYRLEYKIPLMIARADLPDGQRVGSFVGTLFDMSAGGIGFKSERLLPPDTVLEVPRLFDPLVSLKDPQNYLLDVRWCRAFHPEGFRAGAAFRFENAREQERIAKLVHQLQVVRLSRYCRILNSK